MYRLRLSDLKAFSSSVLLLILFISRTEKKVNTRKLKANIEVLYSTIKSCPVSDLSAFINQLTIIGESIIIPTIKPVNIMIFVFFSDSSSNVAEEKIEFNSYIIRTIIIPVLSIMIAAAEEKASVILQCSKLKTMLKYCTT